MRFLIAIFVLFSLLVPVKVEAQTKASPVSLFCLDETGKKLSWPVKDACTAPLKKVVPTGVTSDFKGVCVLKPKGSSSFQIVNAEPDVNGVADCAKYIKDTAKYDSATKILKEAITGTPPTTVTPTTKTDNPTTKTDTPTTKSPTKTTTVGSQGGCPGGFQEKGPLCLPDNPFASSSGIAGRGTIGELASSIIGILLFAAGMVAVIMIIIGGYIWMTSRGNESQTTNGRKTLVNALIGLIIVILAYAIVQGVTNFVIKGT